MPPPPSGSAHARGRAGGEERWGFGRPPCGGVPGGDPFVRAASAAEQRKLWRDGNRAVLLRFSFRKAQGEGGSAPEPEQTESGPGRAAAGSSGPGPARVRSPGGTAASLHAPGGGGGRPGRFELAAGGEGTARNRRTTPRSGKNRWLRLVGGFFRGM